jgi:hypothetical protein
VFLRIFGEALAVVLDKSPPLSASVSAIGLYTGEFQRAKRPGAFIASLKQEAP